VEFRGAFRVLRRGEISAPPKGLRPLLGKEAALDVRRFPCAAPPAAPRLFVSAPRRAGSAVQRNRFRRRVRMAFLAFLREHPGRVAPGQVVWIRPGPSGCEVPFGDVLSLLRRAILS
jgi:RNase P protein component